MVPDQPVTAHQWTLQEVAGRGRPVVPGAAAPPRWLGIGHYRHQQTDGTGGTGVHGRATLDPVDATVGVLCPGEVQRALSPGPTTGRRHR